MLLLLGQQSGVTVNCSKESRAATEGKRIEEQDGRKKKHDKGEEEEGGLIVSKDFKIMCNHILNRGSNVTVEVEALKITINILA